MVSSVRTLVKFTIRPELGPDKLDNFNNGASTGAGRDCHLYQCDSAITEALTGVARLAT